MPKAGPSHLRDSPSHVDSRCVWLPGKLSWPAPSISPWSPGHSNEWSCQSSIAPAPPGGDAGSSPPTSHDSTQIGTVTSKALSCLPPNPLRPPGPRRKRTAPPRQPGSHRGTEGSLRGAGVASNSTNGYIGALMTPSGSQEGGDSRERAVLVEEWWRVPVRREGQKEDHLPPRVASRTGRSACPPRNAGRRPILAVGRVLVGDGRGETPRSRRAPSGGRALAPQPPSRRLFACLGLQ